MPALKYHQGQVTVQREANTTVIADNLSRWVGPVGEFTSIADMILFATAAQDGTLQFTVLSGKAPLVKIVPGGGDPAVHGHDQRLRLRLPAQTGALTEIGRAHV